MANYMSYTGSDVPNVAKAARGYTAQKEQKDKQPKESSRKKDKKIKLVEIQYMMKKKIFKNLHFWFIKEILLKIYLKINVQYKNFLVLYLETINVLSCICDYLR